MEDKEMGELYIFPLLQRYPKRKNGIKPAEIDKFAYHYMKQLVRHLELHGFTLDSKFFQDFNVVHDVFKSSLLRTIGQHHPMQDFIDKQVESK